MGKSWEMERVMHGGSPLEVLAAKLGMEDGISLSPVTETTCNSTFSSKKRISRNEKFLFPPPDRGLMVKLPDPLSSLT